MLNGRSGRLRMHSKIDFWISFSFSRYVVVNRFFVYIQGVTRMDFVRGCFSISDVFLYEMMFFRQYYFFFSLLFHFSTSETFEFKLVKILFEQTNWASDFCGNEMLRFRKAASGRFANASAT